MPARGSLRLAPALCCALVLFLAACTPKRPTLPSGSGTPFPEAAAAYRIASQPCAAVRTIGVTLGLSGRAGSQRIRGNVDAGFAAPQSIRLEGKAPFGRPAFILAAAGPEATLYLPRDNRVLREAATASIVEALVGLPLGAAELRALVSGCGFGVIEPSSGREYPGGWLAVDGGEGGTTYLREIGGQWRIAAASRSSLIVHYEGIGSGPPAALRLQATGTTPADVTARLSDLQINVPLEAAAFAVDVPEAADPLTLDELRRSGPLGDR